MTIYIIVLHYKNIEDTISCLESIAKLKKDNLQIKVILVNNNSTSEESPPLAGPPSEVITIKNPRNLGFAAGVNVGIREALKNKQTDCVLILNNDTILPPHLLTELLKAPGDITAPVIKFQWNEKWVYDFGGKVNWWTGRTTHIESTNQPSPSRSHFATPGRWPHGLLPGEKSIDYVSGCCMLVKRKVFEKIGLFDEKYFFYFEDADFCIRAKKAGFKVTVNPNVNIYHKLGGSVGRWTNKAIFYNLLCNFIFISKHLGWKRPIGYIYLLLLTVKIVLNRILSHSE
ncbi:glycosyltransferase family 2 protein [Candidatus Gottesmanbacteria bacterium]|nr:glycosyltransferase family 2 protein [Candidatus Gottesmanbacteria bacterium]